MHATTIQTRPTQNWGRQQRQQQQWWHQRVGRCAGAPNHRRAAGITQAAKGDESGNESLQEQQPQQQQQQQVTRLTGTPLWWAGEAAVLLALLALVDAGYSGDWSRIGVIDHDLELKLQKLALVLWSGHALTGVAAARIAEQQGRPVGVPFLKGFLFGAMGLFEQIEEQHSNTR